MIQTFLLFLDTVACEELQRDVSQLYLKGEHHLHFSGSEQPFAFLIEQSVWPLFTTSNCSAVLGPACDSEISGISGLVNPEVSLGILEHGS